MNGTASPAAQTAWQKQLAAEYAVSAFAQDFAYRLTMFGAPPELIDQALATARDELAHAQRAAEVAAAAGSTLTPTFDPSAYANESTGDPALDIVARAVPSLALGEILALRIVHHLRAGARETTPCAAFERIVRDEPRHAALGWSVLDWLLDQPYGDRVHAYVESELPRWIASLEASFAGPNPQPHLLNVTEEDRQWGLAPIQEIRAIFHTTVAEDWRPRLAKRSLQLNSAAS